MATGPGLGTLLPAAMTLVGILGMVQAWRQRRARRTRQGDGIGPDRGMAADRADDQDRRRGEAVEMERRLAAYLAQRPRAGD